MAAVADTSSIILLAKVGQLRLLQQLHGQVFVPPAVAAELRAKPDAASQVVEAFIESPGYVRSPEKRLLVQALSADLAAGEAEAIALAAEVPGALLIMDDAEGRRVARGLNLHMTGLLGVLIEGKGRGLISAISPLLDQLMAEGFWLSEAMRRIVLDAAGE